MPLLAIFLGPPVLAVVLSKTKLYWLPGVALMIAGLVVFATANPSEGHGGPAVIGQGFDVLIGLAGLVYGLICWVIAGWLHTAPPSQVRQTVALPVASVIDRVSKS